MTHYRLTGPDSPGLGELLVTGARVAAIAISAGLHPKRQPSLDDNEDAVAVALGPDSLLLVAADAHDGADAAIAIVDEVLTRAGSPPPAEVDAADWTAWMAAAGEAAWRSTRARGYPRRASRAAVAAALVTPSALSWASIGDVAVSVVSSRRHELLNPLEPIYLGGPLEIAHLRPLLHSGTRQRRAGEWLVVSTDGLLDFVPDFREILASARDACDAAEALVRSAWAGGAGDHLGVAVAAPPAENSHS
jgi:hypothetical protein